MVFFIPCVVGTSVATAEQPDPDLPTAEQIRQLYKELSDEWPEIPDTVLLLARNAQDRNFYFRSPKTSVIAIEIGMLFLPEKPKRSMPQSTRMSIIISEALTHDEILLWFVNVVDLGQNYHGFPDAGLAYFDKSVEDMTLAEIAYLSVIVDSPKKFHPVTGYDDAIKRRNFFLMRMLAKDGTIPEKIAQAAADTEIRVRTPLGTCS